MLFGYVPAGLGTTTHQPNPFQDRNTLLIVGALALGVVWWWWQKRASDPLTENEGYYDLPEPMSPDRPSGL